jgi:lauroyl/myristoyl acyltransferase
MYWGWLLLRAAARVLPTGVADLLARPIAAAVLLAWPRGRRAMLRNYRHVLPGASRWKRTSLAWRAMANYLRYLVAFARVGDEPTSCLALRTDDGGAIERLKRHLESGRGAVLALPHLGNWDTGAAALSAAGVPLMVVGERFGDTRVDREVFRRRARLGIEVLPLRTALPSVARRLKAGGVVALLVDRPLRDDGVEVEFFGAPVRIPEGAARLALRTGAKVVPVAVPMLRGGRVRILADFGIENPGDRDDAAAVTALSQAMMRSLEGFIRQFPDQWYMFRDFWAEGRRP